MQDARVSTSDNSQDVTKPFSFKSVFSVPPQFIVTAVLAAFYLLVLPACLETRASVREAEEKQVLRKQVSTLQQSSADVSARFQDLEEDQKRITGRVEALENKAEQNQGASEKTTAQVDAKLKENDAIYREEFSKLNLSIEALRAQIAELQQRAVTPTPAVKGDVAFQEAEQKFIDKNWKEAILDYERYRKAFPKGKNFAVATLKIGASFQEMGMADEAKAFYEEVVAKFPKSKEAGRAQAKLKSLTKKK